MKLDTLILAKAAADTGGDLSILGAGVTRIVPEFLPWREPTLAVVLRFFIDEDDLQREQTVITLHALRPDGQMLAGGLEFAVRAAELQVGFDPTIPEESKILHCIGNMAPAVFPVAGVYHFVAYVDGEEVRRQPLVVLPPPASEEAASPAPAADEGVPHVA